MTNKTLTFKEYLSKKLLPYKIALPISLSILTALFAAYAILVFYSENDRSFVRAIAPHISTLVETQDGPELQRFITSVAEEKNVILNITKNKEIIASSSDNTLIGKPYHLDGIKVLGIESGLSTQYIVSKTEIKRDGGPLTSKGTIYLLNPTLDLFSMVLGVAIIVFLLSFILLNVLATKIISTAQKSIEPIKDLEKSIYDLKKFGEVNLEGYLRIEELENIYNAILTTNSQLKISNNHLAESKGRELAVEAYKKLIHDLHTPVAALKQMIKVINKDGISEDKKDFAKHRVAEIAEQILFQVKASKGNLKVEINPNDLNINESVKKAAGQAQMAMADYENIEIVERYESILTNVAHDNMMLGRAISNLVVNAIEASKNIVEVAVQKLEKEISISVSDDGDGIQEEMVSLFLQGRGKSKKKNGLGIGLSSANHIVRLHGGKIIYRKSHLGGACFDIRLQG
ncbi:HAMP domain-containing sensor histidine kinase [Halobacteriovorax sp. HLS]|uniref:sensor histidine kinase n=1 Tax=Halobacteriovorax sp. HLS TaxID=2234000 RepID=UPI000FDB00CA|nr:HAMP domain-containing sensor histidine kinase [Halobacteriovorax sp. HLS]